MPKRLSHRAKIHKKIRKKLAGTTERPRISVFRSNSEVYVQLIDDSQGHTILSTSTREYKDIKGTKVEQAKQIGIEIGKMAVDKGIKLAVFDRSGYLYHGRIKAIAEGAREGGLTF
ncbi:MAG TPA: 50S ribosomal protein L18 [Bacteroidetes bacterium]|nr:50S ribosomal protein L18 [Bacteroidota bacterium]